MVGLGHYTNLEVLTCNEPLVWVDDGSIILNAIQKMKTKFNDKFVDEVFGVGRNGVRERAWKRINGGHFDIKSIRSTACNCRANDGIESVSMLIIKCYQCLQLARGWAAIQLRRWGSHLTAGTLYAGDGLAIEIAQPSVADLRQRPLSIFRNRKGFWALIAQGFCDCNARFGVFDIKWPGGTNDIIAYQMTDIYQRAVTDGFPSWATFVLDEAYSSCGGMHLTPYSLNNSEVAKMSAKTAHTASF